MLAQLYNQNFEPVLPDLIARSENFEFPNIVCFDVGCSGGLSSEYNPLVPTMTLVGFDPLVSEVERLRSMAPTPAFRYEAAYIEGPPGYEPSSHGPSDQWYGRSSSAAAYQILGRNSVADDHNSGLPLVFSEERYSLDTFADREGLDRVDMIKIDTDGDDFAVLLGAEKTLMSKGVSVVAIETQFHGNIGPGANTFCNQDAFLRECGFSLLTFNVFRYTRAALPGAFVGDMIAWTEKGGVGFTDSIYIRDPIVHQTTDEETLLKLALIAEIQGVPDLSAEILLRIGEQTSHERVRPLLDGLVKYSAFPDSGSYAAMIARFEASPRDFCRPWS